VVSRKVTLSDAVAAAADVGPTERPADGQVMPARVLRFGNTALTIIEASQPFTVSRLACTAHLDDAHADDENAASGI
jgi:hypothetical protein